MAVAQEADTEGGAGVNPFLLEGMVEGGEGGVVHEGSLTGDVGVAFADFGLGIAGAAEGGFGVGVDAVVGEPIGTVVRALEGAAGEVDDEVVPVDSGFGEAAPVDRGAANDGGGGGVDRLVEQADLVEGLVEAGGEAIAFPGMGGGGGGGGVEVAVGLDDVVIAEAEDEVGVGFEGRNEGFEEGGVPEVVVVEEGDVFPGGGSGGGGGVLADAEVVGVALELEGAIGGELGAEGIDDRAGIAITVVVGDDDFEVGVGLVENALDSEFEVFGAVVGGDDDAD